MLQFSRGILLTEEEEKKSGTSNKHGEYELGREKISVLIQH
jgi:hypothetical protein